MKKVLVSVCALFAALAIGFAQDVNEATDLYNHGAEAIALGDKVGAMEYFQKAYDLAIACGEAEGAAEVVANCESIMPSLSLSIAKDALKEGEYDGAVVKLQETVALAEKLGAENTVVEAQALIPQAYIQKGSKLLKAKEFEAAAEAFQKTLEVDPSNAKAALYMGQAYDKLGNVEKAVETYELAASLGQEKAANKQLSGIFLKKANAANKAKKFAEAIEMADKSNAYLENPDACYIAGLASQNVGKIDKAIANFEKYVELKPGAGNVAAVKFTIATLYQGQKNNAKAAEYYKMVENDPTYGADAQKALKALGK
ncbi:MAG: tetratricopeptide repeat protein [Bacteroidales bacterium]|nr:tetratricopeptide repeat protein [Bacteroidales bacterium]